jgi:hypothetical protein
MLRNLLCAAVALVVVAGTGLAEEKKKTNAVFGKLVKCDAAKGTICVMVKKSKEDEGTKTEYKLTEDTKFLLGRAKEPVAKDEIKEKFKEGTMVYVLLDDEGKTAKSVIAIPAATKKKADN